jgi:hypothetical protein
MTSYDTIGDEYEIPCPWCGEMDCIQDIATDGCLKPGWKDHCHACKKPYEIWDVEYSATVYVKKVEGEE